MAATGKGTRSGRRFAIADGMVDRDDGFSLVEVLIAALVLATGVIAMAQLFAIAAAANVAARSKTVATILAEQKVEQLRALGWPDLAPGGSLSTNAPGFVDHISAGGVVVGVAAQRPSEAVYTRRWTIESASADAVIVQVRVVAKGDLAHITALRTRRGE